MSQNGYGEKRLRRTSRPKQSGLEERSDSHVLTFWGGDITRRRISEPQSPISDASSDAEFQSLRCLDMVCFPAQGQVQPQAPLLHSWWRPPSLSQKGSRTNNGSNLKSAWSMVMTKKVSGQIVFIVGDLRANERTKYSNQCSTIRTQSV